MRNFEFCRFCSSGVGIYLFLISKYNSTVSGITVTKRGTVTGHKSEIINFATEFSVFEGAHIIGGIVTIIIVSDITEFQSIIINFFENFDIGDFVGIGDAIFGNGKIRTNSKTSDATKKGRGIMRINDLIGPINIGTRVFDDSIAFGCDGVINHLRLTD